MGPTAHALLPIALLSLVTAACGDDVVLGELLVSPVSDASGTLVGVTARFQPTSGNFRAGRVYLEFQAVGTELIFMGSTPSTAGCLQLPASMQATLHASSDMGLPADARVRVAAWQPPEPEKPESPEETGGRAAPAPVTPEMPCSGILIADFLWVASSTGSQPLGG